MRSRFKESYGAGPLHLIAVCATLAICGYAIVEIGGRSEALDVALWFAAAVLVHDLLAFPLYSLLGAVAGRAAAATGEAGRSALNYVRVPAVLSAFALIVWFPLILGFGSEGLERRTGMPTADYLGRWFALSAVLFLGSGLIYAVRARLAASEPRGDGAA
jgi:hypothetical protein